MLNRTSNNICFPASHQSMADLMNYYRDLPPISETLVQCGDLYIFACHKLGLSSARGMDYLS